MPEVLWSMNPSMQQQVRGWYQAPQPNEAAAVEQTGLRAIFELRCVCVCDVSGFWFVLKARLHFHSAAGNPQP